VKRRERGLDTGNIERGGSTETSAAATFVRSQVEREAALGVDEDALTAAVQRGLVGVEVGKYAEPAGDLRHRGRRRSRWMPSSMGTLFPVRVRTRKRVVAREREPQPLPAVGATPSRPRWDARARPRAVRRWASSARCAQFDIEEAEKIWTRGDVGSQIRARAWRGGRRPRGVAAVYCGACRLVYALRRDDRRTRWRRITPARARRASFALEPRETRQRRQDRGSRRRCLGVTCGVLVRPSPAKVVLRRDFRRRSDVLRPY